MRHALLLTLLCASAHAAAPRDYARAFEVSAREEGAYVLALGEEVYREVTTPDARDLAAFNAAGEPLAFGPLPEPSAPPPGAWRTAAWFRLPATARAGGDDALYLHVRRQASGELALDAALRGGARAGDGRVLLVDVRAEQQQVEALAFDFAPGAAPFSAEVSVEASDDLRSWTPVTSGAPVALLRQGAHRLQRRVVELSPREARYLRVRSQGALPVAGVQLRLRAPGAAPPLRWLEATFVRREDRAFVYRSPARVAASRLDVALPGDGLVAELALQSRETEREPWRARGELVAFQLSDGKARVTHEPVELDPTREREWRLETRGPLATPPVLRLGYVPERWLVLTRGPAPYVVTAGSARAHRDAWPLEAMVQQLRERSHDTWKPAEATLGPAREAGGLSALEAPAGARTRGFVLWAVLLLGAGAVVTMVVRLMRAPPTAS